MGRASKDKRDIFYRKAKEEGYRARSAYKLLQILDQIPLISPETRRVVDLCAAPGSWSQVLAARVVRAQEVTHNGKKIRSDYTEGAHNGRQDDDSHPSNGTPSVNAQQEACIVAVDLQEIAPIDGVITVQGDITSQNTACEIIDRMHGELAELVVCDGAPDVTGLHELDEYLQHQLLFAAANIAAVLLRTGGHFVAKLFRGRSTELVCMKMQLLFQVVSIVKPRSSRNSSMECFLVARGFCPQIRAPLNRAPATRASGLNGTGSDLVACSSGVEPHEVDGNHSISCDHWCASENAGVVQFMTCGDLSGYDADVPYPADGPTLPPIAPSKAMLVRQTLRKTEID